MIIHGQVAAASNDYCYDAQYRLIEASGREHLGQAGGAPMPHSPFDELRSRLAHPGNGNAMGRYIERYLYDAVGNFLEMQHRGSDPLHAGWTRSYAYTEASLIEPAQPSNRLSSAPLSTDPPSSSKQFSHDAHGNTTRMPHLPLMEWDWRDQLRATAQQVVRNGGTPEITYCVYDATGARVRKVTERQAEAGEAATRKQ
ncbi:MAG TPA: hypothetical protein PLX97_05655, partial [Gemmatales bacterium]|nr:hypothetical protein [Gemmatales bacterium]